jgi:hypothetical protein
MNLLWALKQKDSTHVADYADAATCSHTSLLGPRPNTSVPGERLAVVPNMVNLLAAPVDDTLWHHFTVHVETVRLPQLDADRHHFRVVSNAIRWQALARSVCSLVVSW